MGNQGSQGSFTNKKSEPMDTVNFVHSSSGEMPNPGAKKEENRDSQVWQTFTWNYGGNVILLTGSFFKWKQTIALQKQGQEFSVTIQLARDVHQYKFIVDGEWRFSPEDPIIPDANGNINNVIDTRNYKNDFNPTIKAENLNKGEATDQETNVQGVDQFAKYAPKLPPHYETCSFLNSNKQGFQSNGHFETKMQDQNRKFQQSLTQAQIGQLFSTSHCLPPPYHVQVDHLIRKTTANYGAYCITQRFKNKYTTYKYFMIEKEFPV